MADFVIVIAALATLAAPAPGPDAAAPPPAAASEATTAGFRTFPDAAACQRAAAGLVAPPGCRLVCLPAEPPGGDLAKAY